MVFGFGCRTALRGRFFCTAAIPIGSIAFAPKKIQTVDRLVLFGIKLARERLQVSVPTDDKNAAFYSPLEMPMQYTMSGRSCLYIFLIVGALVSGSSGQHRHGFPTPPPPAVPGGPPSQDPKAPAPRLDIVTIEREPKEMAALASSIPGDVEQLKKGLLPSSALDKLKRIEKLSKELRGRIRP
jgi:hypothetical protein